MVFLDTEKKVWKINKLEIPVKENIPATETEWFEKKMIEGEKLQKNPDNIGTETELKFEKEWYGKVCELGLGTTLEEIKKTGISKPQLRQLMAEVYNFLSVFGSLEEAKRSGLYDLKIQEKEKSHSKSGQN
ncbi:MAG: hypothetical protein ACE5R3_06430 [Nitrosopumilaceae archaeon]